VQTVHLARAFGRRVVHRERQCDLLRALGHTRGAREEDRCELGEVARLRSGTFVRSEAEVAAIASAKPFRTPLRAGGSLLIGFLEQAPGAVERKALDAFKSKTNEFAVDGREVYWLCQTRMTDSGLGYTVFEKTLKTRATFRNRNTIERMTKKYELEA
jgi:uncharacterized protein (DUF1697 family)